MPDFDPSAYGPVFAELLEGDREMPLGPGEPNRAAEDRLAALDLEQAFSGAAVSDASMARACLAGLWLLHGYLDRSHELSQAIETTTGSYFHGIMHRREPDFSNAKHWFRKVGDHPVYEALGEEARALVEAADGPDALDAAVPDGRWDPFAFIDLCEAGCDGDDALAAVCRRIQQREWELLFDHAYRHAVGRP